MLGVLKHPQFFEMHYVNTIVCTHGKKIYMQNIKISTHGLQFINTALYIHTVSAPIEPRGSIFQNEFLGGVQFIFDLPGVVIKMGFY